MKVLFGVVVLAVAFQSSQCESLERDRAVGDIRFRNPFNLRQFTGLHRIVGGIDADIVDFPHHIGLIDLSRGRYICGGSAISPRWGLSAAHCLDSDVPPHLINLWGGSTSILSGGVVFLVDDYILHPQYIERLLENDVAVIHVSADTPLSGNPNVRPAVLPPNCAAACCGVCVAGTDVTVTGWGVISQNPNVSPENLQQVSKPIFDHSACRATHWTFITSSVFCTVVENGRDSCGGDSGGPVMRNGVQVGIVSFGSSICGGEASRPAVYVRIEDPIIRDFIRATTGV